MANELLQQVADELASESASLPSLPAVALNVRRVVNDPKSSAEKMARAIGADPMITARLLRVANSVLYCGATQRVADVSAAVVRLGNTAVRDIVTCLVVEQMFQRETAQALGPRLKALWDHSVRVAARSGVIAKRAGLPVQAALLAGLLHDIGRLYLYTMAFRKEPALLQHDGLPAFLDRQHTLVGAKILRHWGFDEHIIAAARDHEMLKRDPSTPADLTDVVIAANLHSYLGRADNPYTASFADVPALRRLNLGADAGVEMMRAAEQEIAEIRRTLVAGTA